MIVNHDGANLEKEDNQALQEEEKEGDKNGPGQGQDSVKTVPL